MEIELWTCLLVSIVTIHWVSVCSTISRFQTPEVVFTHVLHVSQKMIGKFPVSIETKDFSKDKMQLFSHLLVHFPKIKLKTFGQGACGQNTGIFMSRSS